MAQPANEAQDGQLLLHVTAVTHQGKVRSHNEDTIVVDRWICGDSMDEPRVSECDIGKGTLVLVADGMGGHVGGREASRRGAESMVRLIVGHTDMARVYSALRKTNSELFAVAAKDQTLRGMGTTVAGIVVMPDRTVWFNVGDSRVYSVRPEFLRQLSIDDVPAGAGPGNSRITQSLGGAYHYIEIEPHTGSVPTRPGRRFLLCSDGLTDALTLERIENSLTEDDRGLVTELLERSLAAGAPDNVSIVLASIRPKGGDKE